MLSRVSNPAVETGSWKPLSQVQLSLDEFRSTIAGGSRSFFLASRALASETKSAAYLLYAWCRYCDDQIDGATSAEDAQKKLKALQEATRLALKGDGSLMGTGSCATLPRVFAGLSYLVSRYRIPEEYPLELLEGMAMDARGERYETHRELDLYCFRVAGVVGLIMSHLLGVSDERALKHAVELGIAMQMTNIARDVIEDAKMGRIYLPASWLREEGIPPERLSEPVYREKLAKLARRLVEESRERYREGNRGLVYLPLRSAISIAVASQVYSAIGRLVCRRGARAWDQRAVVSRWGKALAVLRALALILALIPRRIFLRGSSAGPITRVWRRSS